MPIDLIYDNAVERSDQGYGKCIRAPEFVFSLVAGLLLKLANEKPDRAHIQDLAGLLDVDFETQAHLVSFALQCFGDALCEAIGDTSMKLRTKPDDVCVLQQEQAPDTWVDVFDFGACLVEHLEGLVIAETLSPIEQRERINNVVPQLKELYADYLSRYTGTSGSFDPMLTEGGASQARRNAAMCRAIGRILDETRKQAINAKQADIDGYTTAGTIVGVGAALFGIAAALFAFPIAAPALAAYIPAFLTAGSVAYGSAALGLTGAGLALYADRIKNTELAALQDENAWRDVKCQWYNALYDLDDIPFETFRDANLSSGLTNPNSPAIVDLLNGSVKGAQVTYATFLNIWKRELEMNTSTDTIDCECAAMDLVLTGGFGAIDGIHLIYNGIVDGEQEYEIRTRYTGHGATFEAHSIEAVPFHVTYVEILEGNWTDTNLVFAGAFWKPVTSLPPEAEGITIGVYGGPNPESTGRLKIRVVAAT